MPQNLYKRIITSIILLSMLFLINFSNQYIFVFSILILGIIICIEANNLFLKLLISKHVKIKSFSNKLNLKFLIFNIITFFYIFFIFCNLSYEIYKTESPVFFSIYN